MEESTNKSLYKKLNKAVLDELDKSTDKIDEEALKECVDGMLRLDDKENYQFIEPQRSKKDAIIKRNHNFKLLNVVKVAVAAVLIIAMVSMGVISSNISNYHVEENDGYYELTTNLKNNNPVPYFDLNYIPQGFELTFKNIDDKNRIISKRYENSQGESFSCEKNTGKNIKIEKNKIKHQKIKIKNVDYFVFQDKNGNIAIYWIYGFFCYSINSSLNLEETLKIAENAG